MPDPREPLGRKVHDIRLACEAERAEAEGRERFHLPPWGERDDWQRELDMRIGETVATAERERVRAAVLEVMATFQTHYGKSGGRVDDLVEAVRQVLDMDRISDEKGGPRS